MSAFAAAAKILTSLAALGQQGTGLGLDTSGWSGSEPGAEGYAATATNTVGDIGFLAAPFTGKMILSYFKSLPLTSRMNLTSQMGGAEGAKEFAKGLSIISWTITAVQLLQLTTGFGTPYDGASLKTGSQQFTTLAGQLKSALPDSGWEGTASEAYADVDTTLQNVSQQMASLDSQLADLMKNQADWVTHMHLAFGILNDVLLAALVVEVILTLTVPAPAGPVAAKIFAIAVASLGIAAAVSLLGTLLGFSIENGKTADALAASYSQLASGIVQNDSVAAAQTVVASQSTSAVSGFGAISAGLSGPSVVAVAPPAGAGRRSCGPTCAARPRGLRGSRRSCGSCGSCRSCDPRGTGGGPRGTGVRVLVHSHGHHADAGSNRRDVRHQPVRAGVQARNPGQPGQGTAAGVRLHGRGGAGAGVARGPHRGGRLRGCRRRSGRARTHSGRATPRHTGAVAECVSARRVIRR